MPARTAWTLCNELGPNCYLLAGGSLCASLRSRGSGPIRRDSRLSGDGTTAKDRHRNNWRFFLPLTLPHRGLVVLHKCIGQKVFGAWAERVPDIGQIVAALQADPQGLGSGVVSRTVNETT